MEFRILGSLEVVEDGRVLAVTGKQLVLLGVLLVHANDVVSADRLFDALWGERPPATAQTALQVYVSQLRKLLGAQRIETRTPGYRLLVAPDELDSARFERMLAEGRPGDALRLWRGRPLAEFEFEPWARAEAGRLEELRLAAEEDKLERELDSGGNAVPELDALVRSQPLRERTRALLMRALYRAGRQADALAVYQDARRVLVEELGIEPGPDLQDLYRRILNQDPALSRPSPEHVPTAERRDERKVVTVLFCDLVGFTSRSEESDPEDMSALLSRFHVRLRAELERFGGTVEKFVGDAVMAIFGAPVAHEDDAERALRAALSIRDWIAEAEDELEVRVGVATGVALVRLGASPAEGETLAVGDVVNTAARLQQAAPQGAIVVGEQTYRATRRAIAYERMNPIAVKGKAELLPAWVAKGIRAPGAAAVERPTAPFVGRAADLTLLVQTFGRAVREQSPQLVTIVGEPGIGKTRLLSEFHSYVETQHGDAVVRQGRCLAYGDGITFWALGEIVKKQAGVLESDGPEAAAEKLRAAIEGTVADGDRQWLFARLAPLVGAARAASRAEQEESFAAWRSFLEAVAAQAPLVLLLEDLHWADDGLLQFVDELVEWVTDVPLLVVATARPELYERSDAWGGGKRNATTLALAPLTESETRTIVADLLPETALPEETQALLVARAGGNPLYAEEFVRLVADRGFDVDALSVPPDVHGVIAARLDTLPPERKQLVHAAAVVGKVFWAGALAAMTMTSKESVLASLHELARKELVRRVRSSSIADDSEYLFWHVLVRDVAYEQIPRPERARLHVAAAQWIERIAGDRAQDHAEFLAYHYRTALELAQALGSEVDSLRERAATFSIVAGDRALYLDVGRAAHFYRGAVDLLEPDDPRRPKLLVAASDAALKGGWSTVAQVEEELTTAIAELRGAGDDIATADLLRQLSFARVFRAAAPEERLGPLEEARSLLERHPPTRELALVYEQLVLHFVYVHENDEVIRHGPRAVELMEHFELRDEVAVTQSRVLSTRCYLGDPDALREYEQLEQLVTDPDVGYASYTVSVVLNNGVVAREHMGARPDELLEAEESVIAFGEARGLKRPAAFNKANSLESLYDLGEWDRLVARAGELATAETTFTLAWILSVPFLTLVLAHRGDLVEASKLLERALPRAREQRDMLPYMLSAAAAAALAGGDLTRAVALLEELESINLPCRSADVTRACAATGQFELLRRILEGPHPSALLFAPYVNYGSAVLAEAEGDVARAERAFAESAATWRERGYVVEHAHALVDTGRCRIALGRRDDAIEPLSEARATFDRLRARTLVEQIDGLVGERLPAQAAK